MERDSPVAMTDDEIDALLGTGGTGVLSLSTAADESPHSVPVSYGYDADDRTFYLRLAVGGDTGKGELDDRPVSLVVHDEVEGEWRSVVADGRLEDADEAGIATETLAGLDRVHIPLVDIFEQSTRATSFEFYRLDPAHLTGRREAQRG